MPALSVSVFVFLVIYWVVTWPYQLGTYLAVQMGADNPSTARSVLGWFFEIVYLVVVIGGYFAYRADQARQKEQARVDQENAEIAARADEQHEQVLNDDMRGFYGAYMPPEELQ